MTNRKNTGLICLVVSTCLATAAQAGTLSYTGILSSPQDSFRLVVTLPTPGQVVLQTFGFGGGINAAGEVINPGGTDPFLGVFSGTGDTAAILPNGPDVWGTSLILTNFDTYQGCPLAENILVAGKSVCGDVRMSLFLIAGTYTILLSDGQYIPFALWNNGTLADGFVDFTGDAFCNVEIEGTECSRIPANTGAWALDVTTPDSVAQTPEPAAALLFGTAMAGLAVLRRRRPVAAKQESQESTKG